MPGKSTRKSCKFLENLQYEISVLGLVVTKGPLPLLIWPRLGWMPGSFCLRVKVCSPTLSTSPDHTYLIPSYCKGILCPETAISRANFSQTPEEMLLIANGYGNRTSLVFKTVLIQICF